MAASAVNILGVIASPHSDSVSASLVAAVLEEAAARGAARRPR